MYNRARLDVYASLTKIEDAQPEVSFSVPPEELLDWNVSPEQAAADDIFEIYGRYTTITLLREGAFGEMIRTKQASTNYPEYYDKAFRLVDTDSGEIIFTGCLRLENVQHDYDSNVMEITLTDALEIWITQSRKHSFVFSEANKANSWKVFGDGRNIYQLIMPPVVGLALNMDGYIIYPPTSLFNVYNQILEIEGYANDFGSWEFTDLDIIMERKWAYVYYNATTDQFTVMLIHACAHYIDPLYLWRYRYIAFRFNRSNVLQVQSTGTFMSNDTDNVYALNVALVKLLHPNTGYVQTHEFTIGGDPHNTILFPIMYVPSSAYVEVDGKLFLMQVQIDQPNYYVAATAPVSFNEVIFSDGKNSFESIMRTLIAANVLQINANRYGTKEIRYSVLHPEALSAGFSIPDSAIITQRRQGTLASTDRLVGAISGAREGDSMATAIKSVYRNLLSKISCKLTFFLIDSYFSNENIRPYKTIEIDGYPYIITSIEYPENGVFAVEAVGEWN